MQENPTMETKNVHHLCDYYASDTLGFILSDSYWTIESGAVKKVFVYVSSAQILFNWFQYTMLIVDVKRIAFGIDYQQHVYHIGVQFYPLSAISFWKQPT